MSIYGNSDITTELTTASASKSGVDTIGISSADVVTETFSGGSALVHTGAAAASKIGSGTVAGGGFAAGNDLAKAEAIAEIVSDVLKRVHI